MASTRLNCGHGPQRRHAVVLPSPVRLTLGLRGHGLGLDKIDEVRLIENHEMATV
jgi:hypothetical protein